MIKENTKKTLVWLYPTQGGHRVVSKTRISWVTPQLSPAGLRTHLYQLQQKQLIMLEPQWGETAYSLTSIGKAVIETEMPCLKASQVGSDNWTVLVFLQPPKSDRNFRYLRQLLLQHYWLPVSRGVFVFSDLVSPALLATIQKLYPTSVVIGKVATWVWGDIRLVIGQNTQQAHLLELYSGISKDIQRLISQYLNHKNLDDQSKTQFTSCFNRLYSVLKLDSPLVNTTKNLTQTGPDLLAQIQHFGEST